MDDDLPRLHPGEVAARAEADRERFRRVADDVAALRVTRASAAGEVEVTVDGQGRLVDVRFGERFRSADPARLAADLMRCVRRAQSALPDLVADAAASSGSGSADTVRAMVEGYRHRFPELEAPEEPSVPRTRRPGATWLR